MIVAGPDGARYEAGHADTFRTLNEPFALALLNALRFRELDTLRGKLSSRDAEQPPAVLEPADAVVGADAGLEHVMSLVRSVAGTDSPVMLAGETGTGKELLAGLIHRLSARRSGPLVRVNCSAIAEPLADSQLCGHEPGAFSSRGARHVGYLERAHQGTLILDEVGDLNPTAQARLLSVLKARSLERVGSCEPLDVDLRVISTTSRDLGEMVEAGTFRSDLLFRLNVFPITIPPLRERREDIPALLVHLASQKARQLGLPAIPIISNQALARLAAYDWPGNVRELQNAIERALILSRNTPPEFLDLGTSSDFSSLRANTERTRAARVVTTLDEAIADHIRSALAASQGRIEGAGGAAERLGVKPSTLRSRMKKLAVG
jgi:DNA-binding NtrC family response regulator